MFAKNFGVMDYTFRKKELECCTHTFALEALRLLMLLRTQKKKINKILLFFVILL